MPAHLSTTPGRRWLALVCLGATAVTVPLPASAQTIVAPTTTPSRLSHRAAYTLRRETLDHRISSMHAELKITPAEEVDWTKVADVMRRNESDMQKMVADRQSKAPHQLSAVDDLKTYQNFTQAHVDGLKDLIASFETLYAAMPADQKALADRVFAKYGRERAETHHAMLAHS